MMLVSILIPAYNAGFFISDCLYSIIKQTYKNLQIVIVDDGSQDNTLEICKCYAETDKRIEYYHQENKGVSATRNHLLEKVKGDYVLFIDADDWVELDMVEYLVDLITENSTSMVMCDRVINDTVPIKAIPLVKKMSQDDSIKDFLYHDYFIGSLCNKLIKSSLLKNKCFNEEISYGEDALFIWNVLQDVDTVVVSTKQLYHYRMNENSISHLSFGEKKMTGHITWQLITDDVRQFWPKYLYISLGTFALQDLSLLRAASQNNYAMCPSIKEIQNNIKNNITYLKQSRTLALKEHVYIHVICHLYCFGKIYYRLHKLKNMFK